MSGDVLDALLILIPPFILYFKQILLLFATLNYGKGEALSAVEPSFKWAAKSTKVKHHTASQT